MIIVAICKLIENKNIKSTISPIISVFFICFWFVLNLLPLLIYKYKNNLIFKSLNRNFANAEGAGLKISHLLLNSKYFDESYYSKAVDVTENLYSYLGIIGIIGFIILILCLFFNSKDRLDSRIYIFSKLNISMILFNTIGGFVSLWAFFITSLIRSVNRVSVLIAYMSILTTCILIDRLKIKRNFLYYISLIIFVIISVYEQIPPQKYIYDQRWISIYDQMYFFRKEKRFIEKIESTLPPNSLVYQVPTYPFTDAIYIYGARRNHYKQISAYFFSKNIKWSYAYDYGSPNTKWYETVNTMNAHDMLNELVAAGFNGLYIDKYIFVDINYANKLIDDIKSILNQEPIMDIDKEVVFFNLESFRKNGFDKNYKPLITDYLAIK